MFKILLVPSVDTRDLYLFHIISLVSPDFKLVNNLISSSLDKVTTDIYNLQSFPPSKFISRCILVIMQFLFHFNSKDTSQLINGMFNALQKLPKYFNGMARSILFLPELFAS